MSSLANTTHEQRHVSPCRWEYLQRVTEPLRQMRELGMTYQQIADEMNRRGVETIGLKQYRACTVYMLLKQYREAKDGR